MSDLLVNRVTESSLISLDLEELAGKTDIVGFDLQPFLFMGLILKEKEFRESLKVHDWSAYSGKIVCVFCSADAIIPMWAYMLIGVYLEPVALSVQYGTVENAREKWILDRINGLNVDDYSGKRVVVKGCGDEPIKESAYMAVAVKLRPVVKSLMFGEPCSTVPIFKSKV